MSRPAAWVPLPESWRNRAWLSPGSVLLESTLPCSGQHRSFLFTAPVRYLTATTPEQLTHLFPAMQQAVNEGFHLAGYLTYEAGVHMHGLPARALLTGSALARFGVYRQPEVFNHLSSKSYAEVQTEPAEPSPPEPLHMAMLPTLSFSAYRASIAGILDLIGQGDTYQVNFTMPFQSRLAGDGLEVYRALVREQPCSYSALLQLDTDRTLLSFSPELFFATDSNGSITTRPMKGTAPRAATQAQDADAARALQNDEKNRAEHVMIVDLMRNDLGRICETGSIHVDDLFHVEPYPTVHQMVSTVSGRLKQAIGWHEIFQSIFPSGSITGAPKRRTMQIIHELESTPRDIYTGAIGYIAPSGESAFSVAIRTLALRHGQAVQALSMGVGGGIVADSTAHAEWQECLLKSSFVHRASEELLLLETMLLEGTPTQVRHLPLHVKRLKESAFNLGFRFNEKSIRSNIENACLAQTGESRRLRLTLSREGNVHVAVSALDTWPKALRVIVARERTLADDPALRHKTTFRHTYDTALRDARAQGWTECLFLNTRGELTEGCITNLLLQKKDRLYTPAAACGVLPGVMRQRLLTAGLAQETVLSLTDMEEADALYLCNSVRGIVPVKSVQVEPDNILLFDVDPSTSCASRWHELLAEQAQ